MRIFIFSEMPFGCLNDDEVKTNWG